MLVIIAHALALCREFMPFTAVMDVIRRFHNLVEF